MKSATKKSTAKSTATARVVDGKLILSYPDALNPVVWQMDLTQAKASAMEVRDNKGTFMLTLKTAKGETTDIAPFTTKEEAVDALMVAARALENAHGQIRPVANGTNVEQLPVEKNGKGRWAGATLGIIMIVILIGIWGSLTPRPAANGGSAPVGSNPAMTMGGSAGDENGVPLSADEFLRKRTQ